MSRSADCSPLSDHRRTVIHLVHSLDGGGTERTLVALLRSLNTQLRHVVVTMRRAGPLSVHLPNRVACVALEEKGPSRWAWVQIARVARNYKAAIIHARNTGCWFDALAARALAPRAAPILGFHGLESAGGFSAVHRRLAALSRRLGVGFTSVSQRGRDQLMTELGIADGDIRVIPNGVSPAAATHSDTAARRTMRSALGVPDDAVVVGCASAFTPVKRIDLLIKAFSSIPPHHPSPHLVLMGDGPLRARLTKMAADLIPAGRAFFTGWREDARTWMAALDVFVSCSDSEGMSNALLESMAAGLPALVTDVGDNAVLVRHGLSGWVVPPGDVGRLSDSLSHLVASPAARWRFGQHALARSRAHSFDRTVAGYEELYAGVCPRRLVAVR